MNVYCLFCQTQKAGSVAAEIERRGIHRAFSPRIIKRQRVQGENRDVMFDLLPGYVFVYSEADLNTTKEFWEIQGILRRLGEPESNFRLSGSDLEFAMGLYRKDGVVGQITVFKEGDSVRLEDPLFNGARGKITKMDYKKQRARVEFVFAGARCFTWVACELMDKKKEEPMDF